MSENEQKRADEQIALFKSAKKSDRSFSKRLIAQPCQIPLSRSSFFLKKVMMHQVRLKKQNLKKQEKNAFIRCV